MIGSDGVLKQEFRSNFMKKYFFVFILSTLVVIFLLILERMVGIGWDYHVDSVTYATDSFETVSAILDQGITAMPNSGYYFIAAFLDQNITAITVYNIIVFSFTNILIAKLHWDCNFSEKKIITLSLLLLLLNPYRIHLASTLLKDTTIIFLFVLFIYKAKYFWISLIPLFLIRIASTIYLIALVPMKYWKYFILLLVVLIVSYPDALITQLDDSNAIDMRIRDFDTIPTFQEHGYLGSIVRGVAWPLLAITGAFVFISPAFAFIFVSVGCVMNIIYSWLMMKKSPIALNILAPMFIFAVLAPGFTSYIRYVYPLIIIAPLLLLKEHKKQKMHLVKIN